MYNKNQNSFFNLNNNSYLNSKNLILGLQHVFAMFGATVLVPALTGLDYSIALIGAGLGTLLFHLLTKGQVPVFLGSSFAFIGAIQLVLKNSGLASVKSGIIIAGLIYCIFALLIKIFGKEFILKLLPPVVIGPVICVIGLRLSPVALSMSGYDINSGNWNFISLIIASVVILTVIISSTISKGFFRLVPIILGISVGYILAVLLGVVEFTKIANAPWFGISESGWQSLTTLPSLDWWAILAISPIAIVTIIEHIGDISANGAVVGKDFIKSPGLTRTLLGDGLATSLAGLIGAPANTTYSENTGVLAVTKAYNPVILRIAAVFAILIGLFGKIGGFLASIPTPILGGISIILFGMISAIGIKTLVNAKLDFAHSRNLLILSIIIVLGIAINNVNIASLAVSGLFIAMVVGVILNLILPYES